jgi:SSS family solute:Na+ symporter
MALGLITSLVFGGISYFKLAKLPMHFSFYAFVIAVVAMMVVSLMTKQTNEKVLDETMTGWYIRK